MSLIIIASASTRAPIIARPSVPSIRVHPPISGRRIIHSKLVGFQCRGWNSIRPAITAGRKGPRPSPRITRPSSGMRSVSKNFLQNRLVVKWRVNDILGLEFGDRAVVLLAIRQSQTMSNVVGRYWMISTAHRFVQAMGG